jgi:hypothetical protein
MTELDPREITDPQPSRFVHRWRCDEKECPRQGEVVEDDGNCRQCGNKLTEREASEGTICDRCWEVRSDYLRILDYDEFDEEEDEIYTCEFCGGEYSYDGGWSTCDCDWRWGGIMSDDPVIQLAFAAWRFDMWIAGYGSYEDIHWAVRWRLLRPFRRPGRVRGAIARKAIKLHKRLTEPDYEN